MKKPKFTRSPGGKALESPIFRHQVLPSKKDEQEKQDIDEDWYVRCPVCNEVGYNCYCDLDLYND